MKNIDLANKIKELRNQAGLSQEALAEKCKLSLRTVQRIENGETAARGHSLNRLADVLSIPLSELFDQPQNEDKAYIAVMNVSALSFWFFPFLGTLVPLVLWTLKKEKVRYLTENAHKLLNFQITWSILICLLYALAFGLFKFRINFFTDLGQAEQILFLFFSLYALNTVLIVINTIRIAKGKIALYQPAIPFLRMV